VRCERALPQRATRPSGRYHTQRPYLLIGASCLFGASRLHEVVLSSRRPATAKVQDSHHGEGERVSLSDHDADLGFGICFQLPVLHAAGERPASHRDDCGGERRYPPRVFVVAAVLTPPDPISQIAPSCRRCCSTSSPYSRWSLPRRSARADPDAQAQAQPNDASRQLKDQRGFEKRRAKSFATGRVQRASSGRGINDLMVRSAEGRFSNLEAQARPSRGDDNKGQGIIRSFDHCGPDALSESPWIDIRFASFRRLSAPLTRSRL